MLSTHRDAVRRPHRRRGVHEPDDHRRQQRLRARHADRARHGHALRHDRRARARWSTPRTRARSSSAARSPRRPTCPKRRCSKVDAEIRRIIDEQYAIARKLIEDNQDKMHAMAKALLEWETIDADQIDDIMDGKPPRPPKDWTPSPVQAGRRRAAGQRRTARRPRPDGDVDESFDDGASAPFSLPRRCMHLADHAASRSTWRGRG